jgi:hypothetical protein
MRLLNRLMSLVLVLALPAIAGAAEIRYVMWGEVPWEQVDAAAPGQTVGAVIHAVDVYRDLELIEPGDVRRGQIAAAFLTQPLERLDITGWTDGTDAHRVWAIGVPADPNGLVWWSLVWDGLITLPSEHPGMNSVAVRFACEDPQFPIELTLAGGMLSLPEPAGVLVMMGVAMVGRRRRR